MDGWDELVLNVKQELVVQQLMQHNHPPNSAVIVTCRSESTGQLQEVASSRIQIMGFTPSDVKEYFSECLKGDAQAVEKLSEVVQQNPQIEASSYLLLITAIVMANQPISFPPFFMNSSLHLFSRAFYIICKQGQSTKVFCLLPH